MAGKYYLIAYRILKETGLPLSNIEISDIAINLGYLNESDGKTPEASIAAVLYLNVKGGRNGKEEIVFTKLGPNLFGLVEWDYRFAFTALKYYDNTTKRLYNGDY